MNTFAKRLSMTLLAAALPLCAHAADKITIMVGGIEKQIYLPAKLTENLGYFREQGLNVELQSEQAGVNAENQMLAGAVQGVVGFYDHTIDLQAKGKAAMSVVQFSQAPGEVILVSTKLAGAMRSPADFKGRTIGVTGLGSSTNFLTQYLAAKNGVKSSQFSVLPVGAGTTFIAAMMQGRIDAGMTTEPTISRLQLTNVARVLVDLRTPESTKKELGGLYPAASLYMSTSWVNAHPAEVQKLANAFVKTMKFINTHSAAEVAAKLPADYYAGDKAAYIKALAAEKSMFTPDGVMPAGGPETVLQVLRGFNTAIRSKNIDLSKTYTTRFVKAAR
ncbi:ABC transporter substrate-binding protein [Solilutibacter silvestris]|uniref:ABC-type nitrate/sulfonate/bicarbonate transport system periplasmic component n=1 Tax=Solilutibacter silvestris TaxID=1645665 RepID=A0A2K1Q0Z9_9GAMM|nr:ABC transporter substrate-binding protein [Lysobacter silvestris]PNS08704.1 ABC-type nitrate/sulfonate/bicarbonate transport system periplasmic component [Lysobacter silvestris]